MELIKISETHIKIMLTPEEVERYRLLEQVEGDKETDKISREGRQIIFRHIMEDASLICGSSLPCDNAFVQVFTSKTGGCELFITQSEAKGGATSHQHGSGILKVAFRFEKIGYLIEACRRIRRQETGVLSSEAWKDERGCYYLIIVMEASGTGKLVYITECGDRESIDRVSLYLSEHGSMICEEGAVEMLAEL
ncbi:MAG: adaptor protein MecA [Clostridia bacterium]|nr:adaptor protein MecA [Clostridia bacterium]